MLHKIQKNAKILAKCKTPLLLHRKNAENEHQNAKKCKLCIFVNESNTDAIYLRKYRVCISLHCFAFLCIALHFDARFLHFSYVKEVVFCILLIFLHFLYFM